ncbi:MAG TPA: twin-arginine translocation signal domain-containing protein, partial [Gemmatimonadaceae bacterium]|nr:twin-arginine translocation signal domain-containing protein [Gemmatimonadaceae bacterium]
MTSRRDFIRGVGATTAVAALYSRDLVAEIIATSPSGRVLETKFKGLADIALAEGKIAGCSYTDVRFTMTASPPGATANFRADGGAADGRGGRGGGGRGGGG